LLGNPSAGRCAGHGRCLPIAAQPLACALRLGLNVLNVRTDEEE
jgi:hypothetical protein